ncbi:MAG TPA: nicotinate phosphoribosyltransferase [Nitrososphaerales archaeon]|nr:nicotinate phosphoribosyltransferase [Nitrososphaerales archaeon]
MPRLDLDDRLFWLATEKEIRNAETTDSYFLYTKEVLQKNHIDSRVVMEVYARDLPYDSPQNWGVLTGIYEVAKLLEGLPINVSSFDEGGIFLADSGTAIYEPVLTIEGRYSDFAQYENPILGLLSSSTSVSTRAARFRMAADSRLLLSFGTRRVHPVLAPLLERACYLAGFDGISNVLGAKLLKVEPSGTMPHALVQVLGDQEKAWRLFDQTISKGVPRVALVDTFWDEKAESIKALEVLGPKLWGVRLDTPASRRGDFRKIAEEVRWELDIRGGKKVKLIASGRLDEGAVSGLRDIVDGFGVGTAVAYPPVIDFSAKIVEVSSGKKREFRAKRGGMGGRKAVYRSSGFRDFVALEGGSPPKGSVSMLKPLLREGKLVREFESLDRIRSSVLSNLKELRTSQPSLTWR